MRHARFDVARLAVEGVDLPLKAGHDYRAMVTDDFEHRATLHVEWPEGAPRPQRLDLTTKR